MRKSPEKSSPDFHLHVRRQVLGLLYFSLGFGCRSSCRTNFHPKILFFGLRVESLEFNVELNSIRLQHRLQGGDLYRVVYPNWACRQSSEHLGRRDQGLLAFVVRLLTPKPV